MELLNPNLLTFCFETEVEGLKKKWWSRLYRNFRKIDPKHPKFLHIFDQLYLTVYRKHNPTEDYNADGFFYLLHYGILKSNGGDHPIIIIKKGGIQSERVLKDHAFSKGAVFIVEYLGLPDYLDETLTLIKAYLADYFAKYGKEISLKQIICAREIWSREDE